MMMDLFLYVCSYVCACIVLFDLSFAIHVYRGGRLLFKRVKELRALLLSDMTGTGVSHQKTQLLLYRRLKRENWVKAFMRCNTAFLSERPEDWKQCVRSHLSVFAALARHYERQAPEHQTLFAHIAAELPLYACMAEGGTEGAQDAADAAASMALIFERQMADDSAFLRQNAFLALVRLGDAFFIANALASINNRPALINGKLLSDGLLTFPGDTAALTSLLWGCFFEYTPALQTCVIDYFRRLPADEAQQPYLAGILAVMTDTDADAETRFAAIRYFRKHYYPQARRALTALLEASGKDTENYAAIAASALQAYPGEQTEALLLKHLGDPDWYVRFNAAESLMQLGVDYEKIILESSDRYAKQMLIYRSEVFRLRNGNGGTL